MLAIIVYLGLLIIIVNCALKAIDELKDRFKK